MSIQSAMTSQTRLHPTDAGLSPVVLGSTIRRIRKSADVSQETLARHLALHQAAICRIELGEQNILPEQLWKVSEYFGVGIDDIIMGTVNYWAVAGRFKQQPPFPERYRALPHSKVRELMPMLEFMSATKGTEYTDTILKSYGLHKALFLCPDQLIGVYCNLDLVRHALSSGHLTKRNFTKLIDQTRLDSVHGFLSRVYKAQDSALNLIQAWILNTSHYEGNFQYKIEKFERHAIELSVTPHEHMAEVPYRDETLGNFLCQYKTGFLTAFPRYIGAKPVTLKEKECHFHGASRCVYKITA